MDELLGAVRVELLLAEEQSERLRELLLARGKELDVVQAARLLTKVAGITDRLQRVTEQAEEAIGPGRPAA